MIYTSYYAKYRNRPNAIAISYKTPSSHYEKYEDLIPPRELLIWWNDVKITRMPEYTEEYINRYIEEVLSKLDVHKVAKDLEGKVLLCYEGPNNFCHRHIVAAWLRSAGYNVMEWEEIE